jgi:hypothetical protein
MPYVERLMQTLSARDWAIIETVQRVRIISGAQLERLHFSGLSARSRQVMRWRVLKRLVDARVLNTFERRIGSARHGSGKLCYVLDTAGQRLLRVRANRESVGTVRRPRRPGERFVAHALTVTELYVTLAEEARRGCFRLTDFQVEAAAYWPDGLGGLVKPDALVKLENRNLTDYWWYEADLATESLPTIRGKLQTYLGFVARGQLGPDSVVPRVLVGVPTAKRLVDIRAIVASLPEPALVLFLIAGLSDVANVMVNELIK